MSSRTLTGHSPSRAAAGTRPSFWRRALLSRLDRLQEGRLDLVEGGSTSSFGSVAQGEDLHVTVTVHAPRFHRSAALGGTSGLGESYARGEWNADDLVALVRLALRNRKAVDPDAGWVARLASPVLRVAHALKDNTRAGSRRNVALHYDLGNDFFSLFLDDTLTYSAGIFERPDATLREASVAKLDRACRKLALSPSCHVLEIGSGWGSFALHAADRWGCRVTTTTLSQEQHALATERVRAAGLSDRITVLLEDYRDLKGRYDRIASIEMIEAVGHRHYDAWFGACDRLLARDGLMLVQAITIADHEYERHRRSVDFIKSMVFPGSNIPSMTALLASMARSSSLGLFHLEEMSPHYATTLRRWREAFMARRDAAASLGLSEPFLRSWELYLAYCEAGFAERYIRSVQAVFAGPDSRREPLMGSIAG